MYTRIRSTPMRRISTGISASLWPSGRNMLTGRMGGFVPTKTRPSQLGISGAPDVVRRRISARNLYFPPRAIYVVIFQVELLSLFPVRANDKTPPIRSRIALSAQRRPSLARPTSRMKFDGGFDTSPTSLIPTTAQSRCRHRRAKSLPPKATLSD